ncbi:mitochondrial PGP phosphatase-domain-containing protein [Cyathus striatus]|nr:mitochondrial PGP phosphatase-domain-containing protein [Cyathus striatus]
MPLNIPGLLAPFQLIFYPRLALPHICVKDIRQLDLQALRRAGYRGAVFDKDNCLTIPHQDQLVPELKEAWEECKETFGAGNVLIVSNSAGTYLDAGGIQSESVSHYLGVPVLFHKSLKPAYSCISNIHTYFSTLPAPVNANELIIVGDRVFTDVIMANRIHGPLAIWTTGVWQRESMAMRLIESKLVLAVRKWSKPRHWDLTGPNLDQFVKKRVQAKVSKKGVLESVLERLASWRS